MNTQALQGYLPQWVMDQVPTLIEKYKINTSVRMAHFLSQCAHESSGFKALSENLNYSAAGLMSVFRKYFDAESAKQYARQPERIANRVYANRMGNGDEESGDGWRYRGRGVIQLTGKNNYKAFAGHIRSDVVANPDTVSKKYALDSAAWWWSSNRMNAVADKGDVVAVTKRVNGGTNGLSDRQRKYKEIITLLERP